MALRFLYITNNTDVALIAQKNGVEWIFVDLEFLGKSERQKGKDSLISNHKIDDVKKIRKVLTLSKLLVRINPIHNGSENEIKEVIDNGADIIMLPYFKTMFEVEKFLNFTYGKIKRILLLETKGSVDLLKSLIKIKEVDYYYIGLNDLSIDYGFKFMFEPLAYGLVDEISIKIRSISKEFGFGGIATLGGGLLPAEYILAEHYRLGSSMAILSRSFCNFKDYKNILDFEKRFSDELKKIREYEKIVQNIDKDFFKTNNEKMKEIVKKIIKRG